jgi:hypothetical protein
MPIIQAITAMMTKGAQFLGSAISSGLQFLAGYWILVAAIILVEVMWKPVFKKPGPLTTIYKKLKKDYNDKKRK